MAKIIDLPLSGDVTDTDILLVVQSGDTKQTTVEHLKLAVLTPASYSDLGAIKAGTGLIVDNTGTLSVDVNNIILTVNESLSGNFSGSIIADDGLTIVDSSNKSITADNVEAIVANFTESLALPTYTLTERNTLAPQAGWVIFNETTSKFQGYTGVSWVDLH